MELHDNIEDEKQIKMTLSYKFTVILVVLIIVVIILFVLIIVLGAITVYLLKRCICSQNRDGLSKGIGFSGCVNFVVVLQEMFVHAGENNMELNQSK